ncbi:MAG: sigma-70 family RNA polymerase sigma factor [Propionibacteriales bacterium]|nr:sigma-70 family RNA polymerase sigma factor [Propionibacteriales bacterium]
MTVRTQDQAADEFERHRGYLLSVAYRLTSSWADAEDAVSMAWTRWADRAGSVDEPRAWLTTVVSRLCLDQLRSAQHRREVYTGPWLPEPLVQIPGQPGTRPDDPVDLAVQDESVRLAFLVVLDTLSPEQRLAVVLHDVLEVPFVEIAEVLGCSPAAARQHATRGRRKVDAADPTPRAPAAEINAVLGKLADALAAGDISALTDLLAPDAVMLADGAGQVSAAGRPLLGSAEIARFLFGLSKRYGATSHFYAALVNGDAGFILRVPEPVHRQPPIGVYAFAVRGGRIQDIYAVLAPDKVTRIPEIDPSAAQWSPG